MFLPQEIIRKKRNHQELTKEDINEFIKGVTNESVTDSQIAALTMAIFLNGFSKEETTDLTLSMRNSGSVLQWKDMPGPVVDKHSSGGVGDKVSLMLAPMLAACGAFVPMISGRGLGHTGGTLDKFDSIPGYQTIPSNELFTNTVKKIGCAIIGQTGDLAPADKRIYAVRDICSTVESIPLITASILSKKLAAGLDFLIMDLKCGNGAFMDKYEDALKLAKSIASVANAAHCKTKVLLTDMNQVLGENVGNALEMKEAVEYLQGTKRNNRLHIITMALCAELLVLCGQAPDTKTARLNLEKVLSNGRALEKFSQMVAALGGPTDFVEKYETYLPQAGFIKEIYAEQEGYVTSMNTRNIGLALIKLKGGRTRSDQKLNYATGFSRFCSIGSQVNKQTPLCVIHAEDESSWQEAAAHIRQNITIGATPLAASPEIIETVE